MNLMFVDSLYQSLMIGYDEYENGVDDKF